MSLHVGANQLMLRVKTQVIGTQMSVERISLVHPQTRVHHRLSLLTSEETFLSQRAQFFLKWLA